MSTWGDRASAVGAIALEAVVFFALYWLFAGQLNVGEIAIGAGATAMAVFASHLVGAKMGARMWGDATWFAQAWRLVGMSIAGTFDVLKVLAKHLAGEERAQSLLLAVRYEATGDEDHEQMERALATAYTSISPTSVVIDIDRDEGRLLYHQIDRSPLSKLTKKLGARP